jgi:hypothetical protein
MAISFIWTITAHHYDCLTTYASKKLGLVIVHEKYTLSKIYFTKTADVLCTDGKEISQSSYLNLPPRAHAIILSAKGSYVPNGGKHTGESFLRAGIRQDNVSVKCATTFSDTLWKESANQEVYLRLVQTVPRQRLSLQVKEQVYGPFIASNTQSLGYPIWMC